MLRDDITDIIVPPETLPLTARQINFIVGMIVGIGVLFIGAFGYCLWMLWEGVFG